MNKIRARYAYDRCILRIQFPTSYTYRKFTRGFLATAGLLFTPSALRSS